MLDLHNFNRSPDTYFDDSLMDEVYRSLSNTFGNQFYKRISTKWKPPLKDKFSSSPYYCSALYDPTEKQCLVFFTAYHVFKFNFNPSLKESFLTFLRELMSFAKDFQTTNEKDILIVFPSLSFIPTIQQGHTIYALNQDYGKNFSYSFKSYDESFDPKNHIFRKIEFPLSDKRKISILGFFEFFSCNDLNFNSISSSFLAKTLTNKLNQIYDQNIKVSKISFLLKFRTFLKCITKEMSGNLSHKDILLYENLFQYTLQLIPDHTKKELNFWAFTHLPSYLLLQKASLSGLLIVNSLGSNSWLSPYTSCESLPQIKESWSQGPFYHYDVNSLYPYIMAEFPLPTGRPRVHTLNKTYENPQEFFQNDFKDFFGFLQVYITIKDFSPYSETDFYKHPTLPYQLQIGSNEFRTIFPTGSFHGVFFSPEIEHLIRIDCVEKLTIYRGFQYKKSKVFKEVMNSLYTLRSPTKSPYTHKIIKFLMNSFYGNLSINPFKLTKLTIQKKTPCTHSDQLYQRSLIYTISKNLHMIRSKKFPHYGFNKEFLNFMKRYASPQNHEDFRQFIKTQLPHVAAAIASYGRLFLANAVFEYKLPVIICNTDSIITNKELPKHLVSAQSMGKFKLVDIYENIYVKSLNQYIVENTKKEKWAVGNFSYYESQLMKDPSQFLHQEVQKIFKRDSLYVQKTLKRTPILNKNKIPLSWTFPFKIDTRP